MTGRPSLSGREERSLRTQKDDKTVKCTPVLWNSFSFAGGRGNEDLGQREKPRTGCSQKELRGKARRSTLQVFRGSGLATQGVRQGKKNEEGSSRNARVLHSTLSARMNFSRPASPVEEGLRLLQNSLGLSRMARLLGDEHTQT